jgi:hypothetical protein
MDKRTGAMAEIKGGGARGAVMALLGALALGGCAMSDEQAARLLVAPGDYDLYSCPQLAVTANSLGTRKQELERLMARAGVDAGGRMMNVIGYRPEYLKISGELHEVEKTARGKSCDLSAQPGTDSSAAPPPGTASPSR